MAGFKAVHCSNGWKMPQARQAVKRKWKLRRFGMLSHQGFDHFQNLLLLTAGQLGHGFKDRARFTARFDCPPWRRFTEQCFHAYAQGLRHWSQNI